MPSYSKNGSRSSPTPSQDDVLDPEATLHPPKWSRSSSRYSEAEGSKGRGGYGSPDMQERGLGSRESSLLLADADSIFVDAAHPKPSFLRDSMARPTSSASSGLLSASDYDSVYQLWRQSGTPNSFRDGDDASYMAKTRPGSATDMAMIEKYRSGNWGDQSTVGRDGPNEKSGRGKATLFKGEGGAKGPKDYRAVGLAKYGCGKDEKMSSKKKWLILLGVALGLGLLVVAVFVPISQTLLKKDNSSNSLTYSGGSTGGNDKDKPAAVDPLTLVSTWGTNGSTIVMDNDKSFTYINNFGGRWASQPLNDTAQAQNYTPPLNEEFDFTQNRMLGVNLGGWLVTEPFISPALYEPYENQTSPAIDEFTLSQKYLQEGGQANLRAKMTEHYETFITEKDFADIAAAGLNWVRIPIGFWAIETYENEPFLEGVSWTYFLKAIKWARKYGLRINLDLHAVPGSQNGYNHSGRLGSINFLQGTMGYANGQRTLDVIRVMTEFISQAEIKNVVPMFSVINEPWVITIGREAAESFYSQLYTTMRNVTGTGKGNGPIIVIHDGFLNLNSWTGFLQGADRVAWDTHPYLCFNEQNNDPWDTQIMKPCRQFGPLTVTARSNMGVTMGGETSLAVNDCGLFLNGVMDGHRFDGSYRGPSAGNFPYVGSCERWDDWENYDEEMRRGLYRFALTTMDSLQNFFFWTWKIGNSLRTGKPTSPMWSYSLGLQQGWIPSNPIRDTPGACQNQAGRIGTSIPGTNWGGRYQDWQTGGASSYSPSTAQWPPQNLVSAPAPVSNLPRYTRTKSLEMLPTPTFSRTAIVENDPQPTATVGAWYNDEDAARMFTPINGCSYPPDQYNLEGWSNSGWPCSGSAQRKRDITAAEPTRVP